MYKNIKEFDRDELVILNRAKVAYAHLHNIFEDRIELIEDKGQVQYAWIFKRSEGLAEVIKEYNNDTVLKAYNSCFKNLSYDLHKLKMKMECE